jgi:glycine cleavage system regulatory protein
MFNKISRLAAGSNMTAADTYNTANNRMKTDFWSRRGITWFIFTFFCLISAGSAQATEAFVSGTYQDATGNQYLVTGAAPTPSGRMQWMINSTIPKPGTINTFNATWETGAALGNSLMAGNNNVALNPANFISGQSYGKAADTNWATYIWNNAVISMSQAGGNVVMSALNANGTVAVSITLAFVSAGGVTSAATTAIQSGTYQDAAGNQYMLTGSAPTPSGRTRWMINSTVPVPGTTNTFNAQWETGAALGNSLLAGDNNIALNPTIYTAERLYGKTADTNWATYIWNNATIAMSQVGGNVVMSALNANGTVLAPITLRFVSAGGVTSAATTEIQSGTYQDAAGNQYMLTGSAPTPSGRTRWMINSTVPVPGTTNTFNAQWETGAALGNSLLAGDNNIALNPTIYTGERLYGKTADTNWATYIWNNATIAMSQVGGNVVMSALNTNGTVLAPITLRFVSAGGVTTAATNTLQPGTYQDAAGNQYSISVTALSPSGRAQWMINSTIPVPGTINTFSAQWETGAALGNSYMVGNTNIALNPTIYTGERLYGKTLTTSWAAYIWNNAVISMSQVGGNVVMSALNTNGTVLAPITLRCISVNGVAGSCTRPPTRYDTAINQLVIPAITVGATTFRDVTITMGGILGYNSGVAPVTETYDPATNVVTIPTITVGATVYTNVRATVGGVVSYY